MFTFSSGAGGECLLLGVGAKPGFDGSERVKKKDGRARKFVIEEKLSERKRTGETLIWSDTDVHCKGES